MAVYFLSSSNKDGPVSDDIGIKTEEIKKENTNKPKRHISKLDHYKTQVPLFVGLSGLSVEFVPITFTLKH